jgi:N-methylhydantoinase A
MSRYKLSIDIGGTFVDIVTYDFQTQTLDAFKISTTPHDPAESVVAAVGRLPMPASEVSEFIHGTTLGLNAILERKGARVGVISCAGFEDVFAIGRGALEFADMYRFDYEQAPSIVERRNVRGVAGRIDFLGTEHTPLDEEAVRQAARELVHDMGCEAIAISFLHSYVNEIHEKRAIDLVRETVPGVEVSAGALLANEYREYERTSTAVLDAYIKPVLKNYLGRVTDGIACAGFSGKTYAMNSAGGALTFEMAEAQPIATILSGPAGGVSGALHVARLTNRRNILSVDVGGTSLDACLIVDFQPIDVFEAHIDNFPVLQPIFDLRTLGAGGGSIAWIDNKLLRVGPKSAGAVPGPACYGRGGAQATVTDAALHLGFIDSENFMGGEMALAQDLATQALRTKIADPLGIDPTEAACSILEVLISRTASSIKEMMLERGLDPRDFSLLSFGGCGPLLGPMLFKELEMAELLVPPLPSVFSAWGMMASDLSFTNSASVLEAVNPEAMPRIADKADGLATRGVAEIRARTGESAEPEVTLSVRMRFIGQEHTLSVPYARDDTSRMLFERFSQAHLDRFGHSFDSEAEAVSMMVKLVIISRKPELAIPAPPTSARDERQHQMFDLATGKFVTCTKMHRSLLVDNRDYVGPLLVVDEGSSLALTKEQRLRVSSTGMLSITAVEN